PPTAPSSSPCTGASTTATPTPRRRRKPMAPTSMWDRTEEMAKRHDQGSSTWLKLADDGDKEVVVFLGEPYPREVVFADGKYEPFTDEHKAKGLKPSLRVAFNVALFETKE